MDIRVGNKKSAGVRDARDLETLGRNGGVSRQNGLLRSWRKGFPCRKVSSTAN
jgi:hypothetical protein